MSFLPSGKFARIRRDLKDAIAGSDADYTQISLRRSIFLLAVPMVLEMIMESLFALADIFFVSKLGPNAIATVGLTESMMTIVYAIGVGLSVSTTAIVSRRIGEKKPDDASQTAGQAIIAGIIVSVPIMIMGILYGKELLWLMSGSEEIVNEGYMYTAISLGGNVIIMLLFIMNAVFRSSGDAAVSMRVLFIANLINLVLDPCLIFGLGPFPELGLTGAALATAIGRGIAVIYQLLILFYGHKRVSLSFSHLRINTGIMFQLLLNAAGVVAQHIIATSSWIILIRLLASFGSYVIAGYTIAIRIVIFALLPSWGLSNAASTLVGQNLGAGRPDRAERSAWIAGFGNLIFMGLLGIFIIAFSSIWISFFTEDPEIIRNGSLCLQIIGSGFVFYGFGMVMMQSFNGAGDSVTPTIMNIFCFWLFEIPLAWILAYEINLGQKGIYFAIVAGEALLALTGIYLFRKGKWKNKKV
ncbi:MAG: MATE family efflux transporter [Bacteroidota bacterium]